MMKKIKCVKCKREFETRTTFIKDSREYFSKYDNDKPILFCNLRTRIESKKCQLCNNMDKAFSYVNNLM